MPNFGCVVNSFWGIQCGVRVHLVGRSDVVEVRARHDSNLRPADSKSDALSS